MTDYEFLKFTCIFFIFYVDFVNYGTCWADLTPFNYFTYCCLISF